MCDVSVVILSYNFEKYIGQAIDSVLMQKTDFCYEIIIGDDFSPDNTRSVLYEYQAKYPDLIRLVLNEQNTGSTRLLYRILTQECRGRYVINFDGDDYWTDADKLSKQKRILEENPEYIGVGHIVEEKDSSGRSIGYYPAFTKSSFRITMHEFLRGARFSSTSVLYHNFFFNDVSGKYEIMYKASRNQGDLTRCLLFLDRGDVYILNEPLSVYRIRNQKGEMNFNSRFSWLEKMQMKINIIACNDNNFDGKYDFSFLAWDTIVLAFMLSIRYRGIGEFGKLYQSIPTQLKCHKYMLIPAVFNMFGFLKDKIIRDYRSQN